MGEEEDRGEHNDLSLNDCESELVTFLVECLSGPIHSIHIVKFYETFSFGNGPDHCGGEDEIEELEKDGDDAEQSKSDDGYG